MKEYFENRINRLKKHLKDNELQGLIILKDANIYYLTGFHGENSGGILIFIENEIYFFIHYIYYEAAKKNILPENIKIIKYYTKKYKELSTILDAYRIKNIAIEGDSVSYLEFFNLEKSLNGTGKNLVSKIGIVESLRIIKDESELANIEKACSITDRVFNQVITGGSTKIKSCSERELAFEIEKKSIKYGSSGRSFNYVIANNSMSSLPHYEAENRSIKNGILLMDFGCVYEHYCSDITRTVFIGSSTKNNKFHRIYDIVLQAQSRALEACKEGVITTEIDAIAREYIKSRGYGDNFGHGLGHGVGLEIHESPKISYTDGITLMENMVVTIEPGIYIEDLGGVRIEDMVVITKNGCRNLYKSSKLYMTIE